MKASNSSYREKAFSLTGHLVFVQDFITFWNLLDIFQAIRMSVGVLSQKKIPS